MNQATADDPESEPYALDPRPNLPRTAIFLQDACLKHRFIRSKDISSIVERPERLRAVTIGLSAAIARLDGLLRIFPTEAEDSKTPKDELDLVESMNKMKLEADTQDHMTSLVEVVESRASVDILNHAAVKFIHGDIEGDIYLEKLKRLAKESWDKIAQGESEIPEGFSQGDLYLCPGSIDAIQGAIGTVCEAVDTVVRSSIQGHTGNDTTVPIPVSRGFVAIRPPGHHCGEDTPSGFCFLNNVAVGAAHAHLQHGINRIVILDIDLHHGNGTQSIVWQINEETYRQSLETEASDPQTKAGPKIYYGSIHDILSYPCEDGKPTLVQAASVSLHKSHGQYIENIHLQMYTSEDHFWNVLYKDHYSKLLQKAEEFLNDTGGPGDDVLVFISCGMDACEHEYESMSRHNRKVPVSFYYQFARDACSFSDKYAKGRLVSVLEGGYSDRALISGAMAHLSGLVDVPNGAVDHEWWSVENLTKLESATKKRRNGRQSLPAAGSVEPWIEKTLAIFTPLDATTSSRAAIPAPAPISMSLRDRTKVNNVSTSASARQSTKPPPVAKLGAKGKSNKRHSNKTTSALVKDDSPLTTPSSTEGETSPNLSSKPLPRVILKLGKAPDE